MDKTTDVLIRKLLKGWVKQVHPPQNSRARLLWEASHQSRGGKRVSLPRMDRRDLEEYALYHSNDWGRTLFNWIMENTAHNGIQARVC